MDYDVVTDNPSLALCIAECNSENRARDVALEYLQAPVRDTQDLRILLEAFRL